MCTAELLHDLRGAPSKLRHNVEAPPLVGLCLVGVQAHTGRARVAQDGNQLLATLEARALAQVDLGERHSTLSAAHVLEGAIGAALQPLLTASHLESTQRT
jgi:hypothetical protein